LSDAFEKRGAASTAAPRHPFAVGDGPGERVAQILRLVIFDFDGTLADSWPLAADMLVAQASRFRYRQFTRDEIERLRALPTREVFRALEIAP